MVDSPSHPKLFYIINEWPLGTFTLFGGSLHNIEDNHGKKCSASSSRHKKLLYLTSSTLTSLCLKKQTECKEQLSAPLIVRVISPLLPFSMFMLPSSPIVTISPSMVSSDVHEHGSILKLRSM